MLEEMETLEHLVELELLEHLVSVSFEMVMQYIANILFLKCYKIRGYFQDSLEDLAALDHLEIQVALDCPEAQEVLVSLEDLAELEHLVICFGFLFIIELLFLLLLLL